MDAVQSLIFKAVRRPAISWANTAWKVDSQEN